MVYCGLAVILHVFINPYVYTIAANLFRNIRHSISVNSAGVGIFDNRTAAELNIQVDSHKDIADQAHSNQRQ